MEESPDGEHIQKKYKSVTIFLIMFVLSNLFSGFASYHLEHNIAPEETTLSVSSSPTPAEATAALAVSDPGYIDYSPNYTQLISGWQTYSNKDYRFRFKYPASWIVLNTADDPTSIGYTPHRSPEAAQYLELMPARYLPAWKSRSFPQDKLASQGPVFISCDFGSTPNATSSTSMTFKLLSGLSSIFKLSAGNLSVQEFDVFSGSVSCSLLKETTDASPFTKQEDSEGMAIINTFSFL